MLVRVSSCRFIRSCETPKPTEVSTRSSRFLAEREGVKCPTDCLMLRFEFCVRVLLLVLVGRGNVAGWRETRVEARPFAREVLHVRRQPVTVNDQVDP